MKKTTTFTFAHLLLWLVCATLPLGFTACSDDEDPTTDQSAEPEPEPEPGSSVSVQEIKAIPVIAIAKRPDKR